jgi:MFS family permease
LFGIVTKLQQAGGLVLERLRASVWRHRDFRLLWVGALFSFVGSFVQTVAQGWLVFELTKSEAMLGLVTFCVSIPVAILGPFAGIMADVKNRRTVLVICQSIFGCSALFLSLATYQGWVTVNHIIIVSLILGCVSAFEMPARQAILSSVVPIEELPKAIPLNALTFNAARLIGPAVGALLLTKGPALCYLVNGLSYLSLIGAAMAIKADLSARVQQSGPIKDLIFEGVLYTMRNSHLRTLFIMESFTAAFGLVYIAVLPAYAKEVLHLDKSGFALSMSGISIGTISALIFVSLIAHKPDKKPYLLWAMRGLVFGAIVVSFVSSPLLAIPLLALMGGCVIIQFNLTNSLFQTLAPPKLRGRVIAMHMWALSGIGPIGTLLLSNFAEQTKALSWEVPVLHSRIYGGIPLSLALGGVLVGIGALWGSRQTKAWKTMPLATERALKF